MSEIPVGLEGANSRLSGYEAGLGLVFTEVSQTRCQATWTVGPGLHQPFGVVHGGAYCTVTETVASLGAFQSMAGQGHSVGVNNNTDFFRAVSEGELTVVGEALFQGRSQQVWEVRITDEKDRLVSRGVVRLHNLYRRP